MAPDGYSRRGFLLAAGAAAGATALLSLTRAAARAHRRTTAALHPGVEPWIDRDGWMLALSDRFRSDALAAAPGSGG